MSDQISDDLTEDADPSEEHLADDALDSASGGRGGTTEDVAHVHDQFLHVK